MTNPFAEVRQTVRATRCNVPGVSSRVTKNGAAAGILARG
jgi:hypothetical protein